MNLVVRCGLDLVKAAASLSLYRVWMKTARQWWGDEVRTGSPFIGVFEREGQAVVDGCDLDAGL